MVRGLLQQALEMYHDNQRAASWVRHHLARFDEPLRLGVFGNAGAGKSTVVNSLLGEPIAPLEARHGSVPTWYRGSTTPSATVYRQSQPPSRCAVTRSEHGPRVEPGELDTGDVDQIVVDWPSPGLRDLTLIDTPGLGPGDPTRPLQACHSDADAALYVTPDPYRAGRANALNAHQHPIAARTPVATLGVLSRADELGAGRVDALISARRVARRYRDEPEVREWCQDAVAISALLATAGTNLDEQDFTALAALADCPRAELDNHLLSADRFLSAESPLPVAPEMRVWLFERFSIFGLRLATTLIRQGANGAVTLAEQLVQRSGVVELREAIDRNFIDRAEVLKARTALIGLDELLRREPHPAAARLLGDIDRILAGAHDYRELRLLADLRTGRIEVPEEHATEAARLLGAQGTHPLHRLGLPHEYVPHHYEQALFDALWRWREIAEQQTLDAAQREAARTVVRSCEAMATDILTG